MCKNKKKTSAESSRSRDMEIIVIESSIAKSSWGSRNFGEGV